MALPSDAGPSAYVVVVDTSAYAHDTADAYPRNSSMDSVIWDIVRLDALQRLPSQSAASTSSPHSQSQTHQKPCICVVTTHSNGGNLASNGTSGARRSSPSTKKTFGPAVILTPSQSASTGTRALAENTDMPRAPAHSPTTWCDHLPAALKLARVALTPAKFDKAAILVVVNSPIPNEANDDDDFFPFSNVTNHANTAEALSSAHASDVRFLFMGENAMPDLHVYAAAASLAAASPNTSCVFSATTATGLSYAESLVGCGKAAMFDARTLMALASSWRDTFGEHLPFPITSDEAAVAIASAPPPNQALSPAYARYKGKSARKAPPIPPQGSVLGCRPQAWVAERSEVSRPINHAMLTVTLRRMSGVDETVTVPVSHVAAVARVVLDPIAEVRVGRLRRRCIAGQRRELVPCFGKGRLTLSVALDPVALVPKLVARLRFTSDEASQASSSSARYASSAWNANKVQYDVATVADSSPDSSQVVSMSRVPTSSDPSGKSLVVRTGKDATSYFWIRDKGEFAQDAVSKMETAFKICSSADGGVMTWLNSLIGHVVPAADEIAEALLRLASLESPPQPTPMARNAAVPPSMPPMPRKSRKSRPAAPSPPMPPASPTSSLYYGRYDLHEPSTPTPAAAKEQPARKEEQGEEEESPPTPPTPAAAKEPPAPKEEEDEQEVEEEEEEEEELPLTLTTPQPSVPAMPPPPQQPQPQPQQQSPPKPGQPIKSMSELLDVLNTTL